MGNKRAGAGGDAVHDVAVVGAGPAGLATAVLLALRGARVALVGPADANAHDQRTSALFSGSIAILEHAGVWPGLAPGAATIDRIRIVDRLSRADHPSVVVFAAREIGERPFGYNIANAELTGALEERFAGLAGTTRITARVAAIEHDGDHVRLEDETGRASAARLLVAADGHESRARAAAGITTTLWDYGQLAIATRIAHEHGHENSSTEIHRPGGPLTQVPLPGHASAIVWLERPQQARELAGLDDAAFARRLEAEFGGFLGHIDMAAPRALFPVRGLSTTMLAARRTALVGEAGHMLPPIGAQGLNLSLRDAAWLSDIAGSAIAAGDDPGAEPVLAAYRRSRSGDAISRRAASDLLNRSLLFDGAAIRAVRAIGLAALAGIGPLRRGLMRRGISGASHLPPAMRDKLAAGAGA